MFDYQQVPKSKEYRDNFDNIFSSGKEKKPVKGRRYVQKQTFKLKEGEDANDKG